MAGNLTRSTTRNLVLRRSSEADFAKLEPNLQVVELPVRRTLEARNKRVDYAESGIASVVANGSGRPGIEVGIIGREGMTGLSVVLDGDSNRRPRHETFMQIAGSGQRISAEHLREAIAGSTTLHRVLLRYSYGYLMQTTQTALANGRSKIEERLARWLPMAADCVGGNEFPLTHEFLATMLGVRRPGVTVAVQALERAALIAHRCPPRRPRARRRRSPPGRAARNGQPILLTSVTATKPPNAGADRVPGAR